MSTLRRLKLDPGVEHIDPTTKFDLLQKLGEGSYGAVFKATDKETGEIHAIKVVNIDSDFEGIMKEITILKSCSSPNIVSYHGSYRSGEDLWIVMEYCGGGSISDCMYAVRHCLNEPQIAAVCKQVLQGLVYLHASSKIHRDIKCGNILLDRQGHAKLADFGVSAQLSATISKRNTVIGTPFWMAPEVIQETKYDYKADIWSLGITAIEMAQGKPPYAEVHPMRVIFMIPSRPPPKLEAADDFSANLNDFIAKCLVKNPEARPSAEELLQHPFIANAPSSAVMIDMIEEAVAAMAAKQSGKSSSLTSDSALNASNSDDTVRYQRGDDGDIGTLDASTLVEHNSDTLIDQGTFVNRPAGTTVQSDNTDYRPTFLDHFQTKVAMPPSPAAKPLAEEQPSYDTSIPVSRGKAIQGPPADSDTAVPTKAGKPITSGPVDDSTTVATPKAESLAELQDKLKQLELEEEEAVAKETKRIREAYAARKKPFIMSLKAATS
eukprot:TRINITY_DN15549_c0_g1_i1.p1 TRINITY_DN15549_c0_g1~~TRINITY_DN15549_c0_g1_i1.p1  ORF type:complete len:493 (+),score=79.87 TRINITY_DN15549_c0_g1_i1:55-1533(+)